MKIFQILLMILFMQGSCFAYTSSFTTYSSPYMIPRLYRRGFMTGIPAPIVQYNIPQTPEPYYVNRKHIKKKYRKYYPDINSNSSFTIIEN